MPAIQRAQKRKNLIIGSVIGVVAVGLIVLGIAWGPMQRSSQLTAMDACRDPEQSRTLAAAFVGAWGADTGYARAAVQSRRGSIEARVEMCRLGHHRDLLAGLLELPDATIPQRALIVSTLAADWPEGGKGAPRLPAKVGEWAAATETDPALATAAVRLLLAAGPTGADVILFKCAVDRSLSGERALAAAEALAAYAERHGGDPVPRLLEAVTGPHRRVLLGSEVIAAAVAGGSTPAHAARLLGLLGEADLRALVLGGLSGPRMEVPVADAAARASFTTALAPYLAADTADAVLAGALRVAKRQRLFEARTLLLALLPRLATKPPAGLERADLADIYGRALVVTTNEATTAAAEDVIAGLSAAIVDPVARPLATAALCKVQESSLRSLRAALDVLAAQTGDAVCRETLNTVVGRIYNRDDIVAAAGRSTWAAVLASDGKRRARYEAMIAWLAAHADDTTVRAGKEKLTVAQAELKRYREDLLVWQDPRNPPPMGLSRASIDDLARRVNWTLGMVNKAFGTE